MKKKKPIHYIWSRIGFSERRERAKKKKIIESKIISNMLLLVFFCSFKDFSLCEFLKKSYLWDRCCILLTINGFRLIKLLNDVVDCLWYARNKIV